MSLGLLKCSLFLEYLYIASPVQMGNICSSFQIRPRVISPMKLDSSNLGEIDYYFPCVPLLLHPIIATLALGCVTVLIFVFL